ncbi:MAG: TIGR03560 family F420-dependent LLM class oxidoreductase [Candidatus Heimdallarchaeota archaeon]|nr:TIGR03560 family F420-dependent LLM class oxidoreductase [Candidatus Heimdallarchaeota archaeon]MBY8995662.1 TIGR03560 family F420-dependent LLM class oxidoreductase [Candidatus Heimdallarchaeota archaeon]
MTVKFGIQIEPQMGFVYKTVEKIALEAEKIGYDSIWSSDHFFLDAKSEDRNCMEAWTLISALAAVTKKIKLGTLVTCNSYRYPAVLAKIAATVDMISNGRLIFGFGAGWKEMEYNAYGIPFPSTLDRLYQMEEAIEIIKLLWTEPKVTYEGKYYQIKDAFSAPKPVQKPWPPIMIGGMGEKVLLKMVAKHADYCNFFLRPKLERSLEILKAHCKVVGRNYDDIGKSLFAVGIPIFVSKSEEEIEDYLKGIAERYDRPLEAIKERIKQDAPGSWVGFPEEVIERFEYLNSLGFDSYQVMFAGFDEKIIKYSQDFAELVMKKL